MRIIRLLLESLLLPFIIIIGAWTFLWMLPMGILSEVFNRELAEATGGDVYREYTYRVDLDLAGGLLAFYAFVALVIGTIKKKMGIFLYAIAFTAYFFGMRKK